MAVARVWAHVARGAQAFALLRLLLVMSFLFSASGARVEALPAKVTVRLFESHAPAKVLHVAGPFEIVSMHRHIGRGDYKFEISGGRICLVSDGAGIGAKQLGGPALSAASFVITGLAKDGLRMQYSTSAVRHYSGLIKVGIAAGNLQIDNVVPTPDYVASVVGSETDVKFPLECLKAQAVLTLTRLEKYRPTDYLGDSTQMESYFGCDYVRPLVRQSVKEAWGSKLTYKGQPIQIFYHSTCGGKTSSAEAVFGEPGKNLAYAICADCDFCRQSPFWKKTVTKIPFDAFKKEFGELPIVEDVDCAKRPDKLTLVKNGKRIDESGYQFWIKLGQKFGWDKAPGTRFTLKREGDFVVIGSNGAGHGVGMCQWGAAELARRGKTAEQILSYYFPGTKLVR